MTNKVTVKDNFVKVKAFLEANGATEDMVKFIEGRIEQVEKKNGSRKPTATQVVNEGIKSVILEKLNAEPNRMFTVTELCKELEAEFGVLANQKVSHLVNALVKDEHATKVIDKRKSFFTAVKG